MSNFVPQNSYTKEELLTCGRGELFGAGNAQLPLPDMLMIDRIVNINNTGGKYGKGEIIAELDIHPDLWFFGCHFIGNPDDASRYGMERNSFSPRQADMLMVCGTISKKLGPVLKQIYTQMAEPKWVVAVGACACSGGIFDSY